METRTRKNSLYIGIPKETSFQEKRIPLTPLSVAVLVNNGHEVVIEAGAGAAANFQDHHYSEQGARIVYDTKEVYKADLIIKIGPPTIEEIKMIVFRKIEVGDIVMDEMNVLQTQGIPSFFSMFN